MVYQHKDITLKSERGDFYRKIVEDARKARKLSISEGESAVEDVKESCNEQGLNENRAEERIKLTEAYYDGIDFAYQEIISKYSGLADIADARHNLDAEFDIPEEDLEAM
jgi:hypothetical protein